ncbi:DUF3017 domain-containing protein [uncultured Streptomyces sp.]|uniref:DUF3017 domain-containing protein n=1 Tax=uncultured Streptomyces sp. TaxID=174707 RepID=UPI002609B9B9|nr:DUF3017 domain-containing protein [uncultured Streptomyces sp.]
MAAATSPAGPPADDASDESPGAASDRTAGDADGRTPGTADADTGTAPTAPAAPTAPEPAEADTAPAPDPASGPDARTESGTGTGSTPEQEPGADGSTLRPSRRFPLFTRDTARPEGGGRAAPGDAPAPARQWPLISVIVTAALGLLLVAVDPFDQAFRVGAIVIGVALLGGALLRWTVPSVGMLAVRSRFTDLVTYGLMGALIVVFALMAQPQPWLDIPFLQDVARFTIR